jgi:hypothetical protein
MLISTERCYTATRAYDLSHCIQRAAYAQPRVIRRAPYVLSRCYTAAPAYALSGCDTAAPAYVLSRYYAEAHYVLSRRYVSLLCESVIAERDWHINAIPRGFTVV